MEETFAILIDNKTRFETGTAHLHSTDISQKAATKKKNNDFEV